MANLIVPVTFKGIDKISQVVDNINKKNEKLHKTLNRVSAGAAIGATAIAGALTMSAKSAIDFQDQLADVAKTTGLEGKELENYGNSILDLAKTTRSSIDDLTKIGAIAGQLGIAPENLAEFTKQANEFSVALGTDYAGGVEEAISSVGKLNKLFKDTKTLSPAESLQRTGSVLNQLSSVGSATASNMNDFLLRMGALPDALKPSYTETAALGATLEELGLNSEVASSGLSNLLIEAGTGIDSFAQQMNIGSKAAQDLLNNNPAQFAVQFAKSFRGLNAVQIANRLDKLKIKSNEVTKVVGLLASGSELYTQRLEQSNSAMQEATSLTMEYATKNDTVAAKLKIAENNFQAMSITLGTQLLPMLAELLEMILPIMSAVIDWIKENPKLAKTLLIISGALYGISIALQAYAMYQTIANIAALAFPGTWIVLAIIAIIAVIAIVIIYFDDFGQAILALMGPIGWLIMGLMKLPKYWENVTKAFKTGGIKGAIKEIGRSIIDFLITPIEQMLNLIKDIPVIGKYADNGLNALRGIRERSNMEVENAPTLQNSPLMATMQQTTTNNNTLSTQIGVNFNDPFNRVGKVTNSNNAVPVSITKTNGQR